MANAQTTPNLFARLKAVMEAVGYIKKDAESGTGGKGIARDLVVATLRPVLLKHGIYVSTSEVPGTGKYVQTGNKSGKGAERITYIATYATTFVNVDNPEDRHTVANTGQGDDYGDKGPGKAHTYAEKTNLRSAFLLETGIADEGRLPGDGDEPEGNAGDPTAGEENLANFEAMINASEDGTTLRASHDMAIKYIEGHGNAEAERKRIRECATKRKGVLQEQRKAKAAA